MGRKNQVAAARRSNFNGGYSRTYSADLHVIFNIYTIECV